MTTQKAMSQLLDLQRQITACNNIIDLIIHDASTEAPRGAVTSRREMLGLTNQTLYELSSGEKMGELLTYLLAHMDELDARHQRMVVRQNRKYRATSAIPQELYVSYNKLISDADVVWHEAKEKNDYELFAPYIDQLVSSMRAIALHVAPDKDPFDYWLDNFQEGMCQAICDPFFARLQEALPPMIREAAARQVDTSCLEGTFPADKQAELAHTIMEIMQLDPNYTVLGETLHPFTSNMTKDDVRLTTNYYPNSFTKSMFTVLHEGGHGIYELHMPDEFVYTILGRLDYASVHESQSRFFENVIGRSRAFMGAILPRLKELFPSLANVTADELYAAANACRPSPIRMNSDELSYSLHIIIRYNVEKKLFSGELTSKELPEAWNRMYKELMGVDVPDNAHGVLQDSHWATGLFGYFPSYALGSAYGAQYLARMREEFDFDAAVASLDLTPIINWLNDHIWKYATLLPAEEILNGAFGGPFDPEYFIKYLRERYV